MAVSRRLRYEILRRDEYACRCCWTRVRQLQDLAAALLDAPEHAHADAPSTCSKQCSEHVLDAETVTEMWVAVNIRHQEKYGSDLPQCMCSGPCDRVDPLLCRYSMAVYMSGWMDHDEITGQPEKPSEVSNGTAMDPA